MAVTEIDQRTWEEKLRKMEELCASLRREEVRLEWPSWHEDVLKETAARCESGQEQPLDWAEAKRRLRKRVE